MGAMRKHEPGHPPVKVTLRYAEISSCGRYRYALSRTWGASTTLPGGCLFVMLNPSTADGATDDPTIRRCLDFASRLGAGWLDVVNLYALRATNPAELERAKDPVGPATDRWIKMAATEARYVIVAWGAHRLARAREEPVWDLISKHLPEGVPIHCLGRTLDGSPRHPLYVRRDAQLDLWEPGG